MLTGEKKKDYQREYMRQRRAKTAIVRPDDKMPARSNTSVTSPVRPVETSLPAPTIELQPVKTLRLYDSTRHKPGDKVLVKVGSKLIETTVQETDADGNPIPW
jgi:sRNA-binding protein